MKRFYSAAARRGLFTAFFALTFLSSGRAADTKQKSATTDPTTANLVWAALQNELAGQNDQRADRRGAQVGLPRRGGADQHDPAAQHLGAHATLEHVGRRHVAESPAAGAPASRQRHHRGEAGRDRYLDAASLAP